jgi:ornithine cyclodeaminase/alanine dehydrogenase-like protein (mu-crystallin family)
MSESTLYLTEEQVTSLVDLGDAIDALEDVFARDGAGETVSIPKALGTFGDQSSLHALGSAIPSMGLGGFKTWINTKRGAVALMNVFDVERGRLLAIIEAGALGNLRTSAISGVAVRWLVPSETAEMTLIGTGRQALLQVAAIAMVLPLRRLRVFSPTAERRREFVTKAKGLFGFAVEESASLEAAVDHSPLVTLVTRARAPFLRADMLARGTHLNAVGAILPANAEFTQDVFDRASPIVVDSIDAVQQNSREFIDRYGKPGESWRGVQTLGQIIKRGTRLRAPAQDLSLFKAMGMGISDLAVARLVIERARSKGLGIEIAPPGRSTPRWRADRVAGEPVGAK